WLKRRFVAARAAPVSALDRGPLHGDGVYDPWRTYGGEPFAVAAHVRRLAGAARVRGLPARGTALAWARRSRALVARSGLADAAVRLTITRGAAGDAVLPARAARPTFLLTARPLPADLGRRQERGVAAIVLPFPRDAAPAWGRLKLLGHASAVVGRLAAERRGAAEALYVGESGEVTEAISANLFLVERSVLVTPPRTAGILPGVTRAIVLELARGLGLRAREERVTVARLHRAQEVFLTGSTIELVPIVRLDGRRIGDGRPGATTQQLQAAYAARVRAGPRR